MHLSDQFKRRKGDLVTEITEERADIAAEKPQQPWEKTKFGAWVATYGVMALVHALREHGHDITDSAIYYWLRGETVPRPRAAYELVLLSKGDLTLDDIYSHQRSMKEINNPVQQ